MAMTTTPDTEGTPRYQTTQDCGLLRIPNPRGGKVLDIYGPGRPVPAGALTPQTAQHYLNKGLIEHTDEHGNGDKHRAIECLSAIIASDCEQGWGRPRVAERLRSQGFAYGNKAISIAIKMFNSEWKLGDPIPSERG